MMTTGRSCLLLLGIGLAASISAADPVRFELVSQARFAPGDPGDGHTSQRFLTRDGRFLGLSATSTNLMSGIADINGAQDAYLFDLQSGDRRLLSSRWDDAQRTSLAASTFEAASQDGRFVVISSAGADILPPPATIVGPQLIHLDLQTGVRVLLTPKASDVTTGSNGVPGAVRMSDDGRYIAFVSSGNDLVSGVSTVGGHDNIYFHDRQTGQTRLVTFKSGSTGLAANGDATLVSLTRDGRYLTFHSLAPDQAPATDTNGVEDVFQWDRDTGTITLVTREPGGNAAGGTVTTASPQGRWLLVRSQSTQLVPGFVDSVPGTLDTYVWDRNPQTFSLMSGSLSSPTVGANNDSYGVGMSDDGILVFVTSYATDFIPGFVDNNGSAYDGYLVNRQTGVRTLVTRRDGTTNESANDFSATSQTPISADNRYLFFWTAATDIDNAVVDTNEAFDLYRYDISTGEPQLMSRAGSSATQTAGGGYVRDKPLASSDAAVVVFDVNAPNPVVARQQVGLFRNATQAATLVSATPSTGAGATGHSTNEPLMISRDGRFAVFTANDQAWIYDSLGETTARLSFAAGQPTVPSEGQIYALFMSDDARFTVFQASGSNMVAGGIDENGVADQVLFDRVNQTASYVSHVAGNPLQTVAGDSTAWAISPDGREVLWNTDAEGVAAGVTGGPPTQLYVYDRQTDLNQLISRSLASSTQGANGSSNIAIFGAGSRHVIFQSFATDLVPGFIDNGTSSDTYWLDRQTGEMILVTRRPTGGEAGGSDRAITIKVSNDGRWLLYNYRDMDLIPGGVPSPLTKAFLFDRVTRTHSLVAATPGTPNASCTAADDDGFLLTQATDFSADGRFVVFETYCALVPGDTNILQEVYVYDRVNQTHELISHVPGSPGQSKNLRARSSRISADGRYVLYTLSLGAVYRYDRATQQELLISFAPLAGDLPVPGSNPRGSEDFSKIVFRASSSAIVPFDSGSSDAFHATVADMFADGFESGDTSAWSAASP